MATKIEKDCGPEFTEEEKNRTKILNTHLSEGLRNYKVFVNRDNTKDMARRDKVLIENQNHSEKLFGFDGLMELKKSECPLSLGLFTIVGPGQGLSYFSKVPMEIKEEEEEEDGEEGGEEGGEEDGEETDDDISNLEPIFDDFVTRCGGRHLEDDYDDNVPNVEDVD